MVLIKLFGPYKTRLTLDKRRNIDLESMVMGQEHYMCWALVQWTCSGKYGHGSRTLHVLGFGTSDLFRKVRPWAKDITCVGFSYKGLAKYFQFGNKIEQLTLKTLHETRKGSKVKMMSSQIKKCIGEINNHISVTMVTIALEDCKMPIYISLVRGSID